MKRFILIMSSLLVLTGCSNLQYVAQNENMEYAENTAVVATAQDTASPSVKEVEASTPTPAPTPTPKPSPKPTPTPSPKKSPSPSPSTRLTYEMLYDENGYPVVNFIEEPVDSAAPSSSPASKEKLSQNYHKSLELAYNSFLTYDAGYKKYALYGFDKAVTRGSVKSKKISEYSVKTVNYEAYYGTTAYVDGNTVYIKAYNHSIEHPIVASKLKSDNASKDISITYNDYTKLDFTGWDTGLYIVSTSFDQEENVVNSYVYVADNGVWLARVSDSVATFDTQLETYNETMAALEKAKIKPEDCLKIDDIIYPCADSEKHRCDTDEYIALSHEILDPYPDWSDEMKVFALTQWFLENITYDDWRVKNGSSRAMTYGVWDGTYSMWDMHIGVCADFSNAMVIMLREQGIPVTTFESKVHMWNVVYLNGHWVPLDITPMLSTHTNAEDGHITSTRGYRYDAYLSYPFSQQDIITVGDDIWTIERSKRK